MEGCDISTCTNTITVVTWFLFCQITVAWNVPSNLVILINFYIEINTYLIYDMFIWTASYR